MARFGMALICIAATGCTTMAPPDSCIPTGVWTVPATGARVEPDAVIETAAKAPVVLLGETHTNATDHRWQLDTLAAIYRRNPNLVLGFEAFPRRMQASLDAWIDGGLSETAFLDATDWEAVWGVEPEFYLPLFRFARGHRIPMVALNVERSLISAVAKQGWDAVPQDRREGVGIPAQPSDSYRDRLLAVFGHHRLDGNPKAAERFVAAQLTWDRAMAEALATAHARPGAPLAVGIVGRGHAEYGDGIPHQLEALGVDGTMVLLPWATNADCGALKAPDGTPAADAVFGFADPPQTPECP